MKWLASIICLFGTLYFADAFLQWSKSYILKAILTVPAANISEPYQVWLDGESGKSRVDFYDGMDKLYREWDDIEKKYRYFKIYPESTPTFMLKNACAQVSGDESETKMYALNTYLPVKNFKFIRAENVNSVEAQKWSYEYVVKLEGKVNAKVMYNVWVTFKKSAQGLTPVPVRYVYEMKADDKVMDYFKHDYIYFEDTRPEQMTLMKPLGIQCNTLKYSSFHDPIDPLLEFIEPQLEHLRVTKAFDGFKTKHNKKYIDSHEHYDRMNIFKDNLRYINSVNRQHKSFTVAVNHLADLSEVEAYIFLGIKLTSQNIARYEASDDFDDDEDNELEGDNANFDWRDYGAVTPVKDQTNLCGACYAFTSAAAVESSAYIARGCKYLEEVSEQAIVDCTWGSKDLGNLGCRGGTYEYTLSWMKKHGAPLKTEYGPYLAMEGRCHFKNMTKLVMINSFAELGRKKRVIKETLRSNGPLLAAIDSNLKTFLFYSSGVFNDPRCRTEPEWRNHGVVLVGYGKHEDQEYWTIKNSFGSGWGEGGYMRLATKDNVCGLKNFVHSVTFNKNKVDNCKTAR